MEDNITCPFCNEKDFDKIGLKIHLTHGHCDEFNDTITAEEERKLNFIKYGEYRNS